MPLIIAVALGKGGVSKTTVAHALAAAAKNAGGDSAKVALLDYDSQGSAVTWSELAAGDGEPLPYDVIVPAEHDLTRWVRRHADDWDCIVIDGHPQNDEHNRAAARNAHLVVVPTQPFLADMIRIPPWLADIKKLGKPALVVLTQVPPRGVDGEQARKFLTDTGATVASVELSARVGVARNFGRRPGRLLTHFGDDLLREVLEILT